MGVQLLSSLLIAKAKGLLNRAVLLHSQLAYAFQFTNKNPEQIIYETRDLRSHMDVYQRIYHSSLSVDSLQQYHYFISKKSYS